MRLIKGYREGDSLPYEFFEPVYLYTWVEPDTGGALPAIVHYFLVDDA